MHISYLFVTVLLSLSVFVATGFAQTEGDPEAMFNEAKGHLVKGEYQEANQIYDDILEISPNNFSTLKMKGIVQSNLEQHESSLRQFFKVLQYQPNDVVALAGMGLGFGNLGEYQEAQKYFDLALKEKPSSTVLNNYKELIEKVVVKYPYSPTEKPEGLEKEYPTTIPQWINPIAKWWSEGAIADLEFISALSYLIENKIIQIPPIVIQNNSEDNIPEWVKTNAGWWADGSIDDESFVSGIQYMIENGIISVNFEEEPKKQDQIDYELFLFKKYLRDISNNISKEIRYIEYPNPSQDVIKKFLRDYIKWNFEEEVKSAAKGFPDPTYEIIDGVAVIYYNVFINDQPQGLPLDHVSTLENSFAFWEAQELETNGQKARVEFNVTNFRHEANVWVTWVVRDIGEGVLGHAHLGKGVVEVTLGDYNCDGSFQLYSVQSVETIMTHELGHSIGLPHIQDQSNIMYPTYSPSYAYCLLG